VAAKNDVGVARLVGVALRCALRRGHVSAGLLARVAPMMGGRAVDLGATGDADNGDALRMLRWDALRERLRLGGEGG
jgi:hypothetical protein